MGPQSSIRRRRATPPIAALLVAALSVSLDAIFIAPELENVPIDRLVQNLEAQIRERPDRMAPRLNLARVHAMAYASKSDTAKVATGRRGGAAGEPWFGFDPNDFRLPIEPAADPKKQDEASAHLKAAIAGYEEVLRRQPDHLIAKVGRAWCLDQSGSKIAAIAAYRDALSAAWTKEGPGGGGLPALQNYMPVTVEVAAYLAGLLDPIKDAAEIADLRAKTARIQDAMRMRPITPIVVPLRRGADLAALVDLSAAVTFDADGTRVPKRWTWITPNAGWLVFDRLHRCQVASALQWFGPMTFGLFWENGYAALRALDDDGDGEVSGSELDGLAIWRDVNRNGISEGAEVQPAGRWGIVRLSWRSDWVDDGTAIAIAPAGVTFRDGTTRPTYDVLLSRR